MKKGATGQGFIRKEITTYRIGTLMTKLGHYWAMTPNPVEVSWLSENQNKQP